LSKVHHKLRSWKQVPNHVADGCCNSSLMIIVSATNGIGSARFSTIASPHWHEWRLMFPAEDGGSGALVDAALAPGRRIRTRFNWKCCSYQ